MPKHTARRHKTAVHAPVARSRRQGKSAHRGKPVSKMTPTRAITMVETKPTTDLYELELLRSDPDEPLADDVLVTGFEDEDL